MKKLFMLLLALPLLVSLASCDHDDELPDVILSVTYSNATSVDDVLYVVQGDTLVIDSVVAEPAKPDGKAVQLLAVCFRFNGWLVSNDPFPPFSAAIPTADLEPSNYALGIECPVLQVDKTPATAFVKRKVVVVASESDIPAPSDPDSRRDGGTTVSTATMRHR